MVSRSATISSGCCRSLNGADRHARHTLPSTVGPLRRSNQQTDSSLGKICRNMRVLINYGPRKPSMEVAMNWDRVEGNWKQLKGKVKTKWGKLTDDDLTAINGKREQLEGKLQQRYGFAKDQAQKEVDAWFRAQTWD